MKIEINWAIIVILTLPLAWVVAFLLFLRPVILADIAFIFPSIFGLLFGLIGGAIVADKIREKGLTLVLIEVMILVIGIAQWIIPPDFWSTLYGLLLLFLFLFLFGYALVIFTVFLNRFTSSVHRGRVVGLVSVLTLFFAGMFSFFWRYSIQTSFAPAVTAGLILLMLIIAFIIQPWKGALQTYMVPGSIRPYTIWWIIYLGAFGLYIWATPIDYRLLFNSLNIFEAGTFSAEITLIGLAGATFIFTFLPDRLGRKFVFNIATVLLGLMCIFGGAQHDPIIGEVVSVVLLIPQVFVLAFIIGVGAWLIWAEIGSVAMKGRRAAFGWTMVGLLGGVFWFITLTGSSTELSLLVYPIAATLVLVSIFPLTNAREVVWNERVVEDIEISVDSRQVTRALRDLEVDTSLRSIEGQIETQIAQLAKIKGITKEQAKVLRDSGYETPDLIARADVEMVAQVLSTSQSKAEQIIANAKLLQRPAPKTSPKSTRKKKTK